MAHHYPTLSKLGFQAPGLRATSVNYEGATTGRRLGTWGRSMAGPNVAVNSGATTLKSRGREFVRNHPYGESGSSTYVANMVGTGIVPKWTLNEADLKDELQQLWSDWTDDADADQNTDFYGQQALVAGSEFTDGEVLVRFRDRRIEDGLAVPLQLQVIEADHLDSTRTGMLANGNIVRSGIEFNGIGQRIAYWLYRQHPGDATPMSGANGMGVVRVPAEDVLHIFTAKRPGQIRGVSHFSPVILKLHEIDQITDAALVRLKVANLFGMFIRTGQGETSDLTSVGTDEGIDDKDQPMLGLEPGIAAYLSDGEEVQFSNPPDAGAGTNEFLAAEARNVAVGLGITYEQLTGDLRNVNYSSIRAGLLEFRRRIEMRQWSMMVFQFCRPVARRWIRTAVASGAISIPDFARNQRQYMRIDWRMPKWAWVDPLKDQLAEKMAIRSGLKARQDSVSEQGYDVEEVDRKQAADRDRAQKLGLVYDTDPGQTAGSGAAQASAQDNALMVSQTQDAPAAAAVRAASPDTDLAHVERALIAEATR